MSNNKIPLKESVKHIPILAIFGLIYTMACIIHMVYGESFLPNEPWGGFIGFGVFLIGPIYVLAGIVLRVSFEDKNLLTKLEFLLVLIGVLIGLIFI